MSTWYYLPAEIKQDILEYLVSDIKVKFTLKHLTKHLSSETLEENGNDTVNTHNDAITSFLLVNKSFITYGEMERALLHGATIVLEETTSKLDEIETRYGPEGLALVRRLRAAKNFEDKRRTLIGLLPRATTLTKLQGLRQFTLLLDLQYRLYSPIREVPCSLQDMILTAEGHDAENSYRPYLQGLLQILLSNLGDRVKKQIIPWLAGETGPFSGIERILVWQLKIETTKIETTSKREIGWWQKTTPTVRPFCNQP